MEVKEPDPSGTYSYADYLTWTLKEMVELIRGKIYKMSPAPGRQHQLIAGNLFGPIWNYLQRHRCQVFIAPFDVRLPSPSKGNADNDIVNVVQPDVCVVCDPSKIDERGCLGAPDLVIEVLGPHTSKKDLHEKFGIYQEAGVREYWLVDPLGETVLTYALGGNGKYPNGTKPLGRFDRLSPRCLPGLVIQLDEVFPKSGISS